MFVELQVVVVKQVLAGFCVWVVNMDLSLEVGEVGAGWKEVGHPDYKVLVIAV